MALGADRPKDLVHRELSGVEVKAQSLWDYFPFNVAAALWGFLAKLGEKDNGIDPLRDRPDSIK